MGKCEKLWTVPAWAYTAARCHAFTEGMQGVLARDGESLIVTARFAATSRWWGDRRWRLLGGRKRRARKNLERPHTGRWPPNPTAKALHPAESAGVRDAATTQPLFAWVWTSWLISDRS
jgi:hypothetical protein